MNNLYSQYFDIKTDEASIDDDQQVLIRRIKERWGDDVKGRYTMDQLEAWAQYGSPHAFYEQEYSFDPQFIESNDKLVLPEKLNVLDKKFQDLKVMKSLGISSYSQKVYRSQELDSYTPNMRHIKNSVKTLVNFCPALSRVLTEELCTEFESILYRIQFKSIATVIAHVTYRLAHKNGIYVDLGELHDALGIERESTADFKEFIDAFDAPLPNMEQINDNLAYAIKATLTNLYSLEMITIEQLNKITAYLDSLDVTCLSIRKVNSIEVNMMMLFQLALNLSNDDECYRDIVHHFFSGEERRLFNRNVIYSVKHFIYRPKLDTSNYGEHDTFTLLKHEFNLPLSYNIFTSYVHKLSKLGCSDDLAAVLITKAVLPEQGIRTLITLISDQPFELLEEYRSTDLLDHPLFAQLLQETTDVELMSMADVIQHIKKSQNIPLPERFIASSQFTTHLGVEYERLDKIIVVNQKNTDYPYTFLDLALTMIRAGAWTKKDEHETFIGKISQEYPQLHEAFEEALFDNPINDHPDPLGDCEEWGVNLNPNRLRFDEKQLILTTKLDDLYNFITPHTLIITENGSDNPLLKEMYDDPVSSIEFHNTRMWYQWSLGSTITCKPIPVAPIGSKLLGYPGEVRRCLLHDCLSAEKIIWLESQEDFDRNIRYLLFRPNRIHLDLDQVRRKMKFIDPPLLDDLLEFSYLRLPIPSNTRVIIPDIRRYLYRYSPILDASNDASPHIKRMQQTFENGLKTMKDHMEQDIKAMRSSYQVKLEQSEITESLKDELMIDYVKSKYEQFRLEKEKRETELNRRIKQLNEDRQNITEDALDRYQATWTRAMQQLENILSSSFDVGCSVAQARITTGYPALQSKDELDQLVIARFKIFVHTQVPVLQSDDNPQMMIRTRDKTVTLASKVVE